jgi:hypothetical protein
LWPIYLYRSRIEEQTRLELSRYFCEHDPHLTVQHPRNLCGLLAEDIFASGIRLEQCALSALEVSGCICLQTIDAFIDLKMLRTELAPLLFGKQSLASTFKLTFYLHPYTDDVFNHLYTIATEDRKFRFEYLAVRIRNLGPAIQQIEERIK